jgi:transaldolase
MNERTTKIFLDSGDPAETKEAKGLLGFLDGQTTNPSLVAKSIKAIATHPPADGLPFTGEGIEHQQLTEDALWSHYKKIALTIHELLPHGSVSAEVFSDANTTHDEMITRGLEIAGWFPGIYVKLPITHEGLLAARKLVREGINVNMTLCFTQEQAAAVHEATMGAKYGQVYVSPFIGRLDDIGFHGVFLIINSHATTDVYKKYSGNFIDLL